MDIQVGIRRVVDDIDVLIAQLANDTMNTCTLHADTGSDRIDTLIEGLNGYFRTLTRDAGDLLNRDQTLFDLRHLLLEETLEEERACTREDDLRVLVLVVHLRYYGTNHLSLAVIIGRDLVLLRQVHLVAFLVQEEHLTLPHLIELAGNDLTDHLCVLEVEVLLLQLQDFRSQGLTQVENHTTTEGLHIDLIGKVLADFDLGVGLTCLAQRDLGLRICYIVILHYQTVTIDLQVTLVGVNDDIVVCVRAVHLCDHVTERILQHIDEGLFVNSFEVLELRKNVNQVD